MWHRVFQWDEIGVRFMKREWLVWSCNGCHLQYAQPAGLKPKPKPKNTHLKGVLLRCFIILLGTHIGLKMYFSICSGPCYFRCWRAHYFGFKECKLSWSWTTTMPLFMNKNPLMHFYTDTVFMGNLKVRYCLTFFHYDSLSCTVLDSVLALLLTLKGWVVGLCLYLYYNVRRKTALCLTNYVLAAQTISFIVILCFSETIMFPDH